jgi:hypothetical protein
MTFSLVVRWPMVMVDVKMQREIPQRWERFDQVRAIQLTFFVKVKVQRTLDLTWNIDLKRRIKWGVNSLSNPTSPSRLASVFSKLP